MSRSNLPKKGISRLKQKKGTPQLNKHIRISLSAKFSLNWQFRFFGQNFPKKRYLQYKTEKVNTTIEFCIFELVKSRYQGVYCFDNMNIPDIPDIFLTIFVQNSWHSLNFSRYSTCSYGSKMRNIFFFKYVLL